VSVEGPVNWTQQLVQVNPMIWVTLGIAILVGVVGLVMTVIRRTDALLRDLGISLLTGAFFTLAVFALQLVNDVNTQEESFRLTVALSNDLSGFTTDRESLAGMYLNSKTLDGADLRGKDLSGIKLRNAKLRGANLEGANLRGADLLGADLFEASLKGADLTGADLRWAKLEETHVFSATLQEAKVNDATCWPRTFVNNKKGGLEQAGVVKMTTRTHDGGQVEKSWGHPCEVNEHDQAGVGY
jgi:Pentapeptide repeats (8 copies)